MDSFIGWIGGKRSLRKSIIDRFPKEFKKYIEVFGGAGWVLFKKDVKQNEVEIFNDIDSSLVNLYRCIKEHPEEVQRQLYLIPKAHELFKGFKEDMKVILGGGYSRLTDIQRAAAYLYIIKYSFGCKKENFTTSSNKNINNAVQRFIEISERLKNVLIENRDFEKLIRVYDGDDSFFYLDPPYYGTENYYKNQSEGFVKEDHERLRKCLGKVKGKFLLSYNDDDYIKKLYKDYIIEEIDRKTTLSSTSNSIKFRELLIRNYE